MVLPFKMGIYRKRNVHQIGSSLEIPGAYSGKISCYAPPVRDPRGLFRQNLLLRPVSPRSPGLILTKSFAATRCPEIAGAHFDKISCYAPLSRLSSGLILTKFLAKPNWSEIPGAYSGKIFCCVPLVRDPRGLFRQNFLLSPAVPISSGLIPTKSLSAPR